MQMKIAVLSLLVMAVLQVSPTHGEKVVFYDDFSSCENGKPSSKLWDADVTRQWGCGNCNAGVVPENVQCGTDSKLNKPVLQITAHGDLYTGSGPKGVYRNGSSRLPNAEFTGWAWPQYQPSCAPYCDVRRVGGTLHTLDYFGFEGSNLTMEVSMRPCAELGVTTALWMYNYTEVYCDEKSGQSCTPAYQDWCCNGTKCEPWNDKCWGEWVQNLEIDIELPTGHYPTDDPSQIDFTASRFTSITAIPSVSKAQCSSDPPCEEAAYRNTGINQNDGNLHLYTLNWIPPTTDSEGSVEFFVDGHLQASFAGRDVVPDNGQLWLGAWFANAWSGSPNFDTCTMTVEYIRITDNNA